MNRKKKTGKNKSLRAILFKWHYRLGLIAAVFLILIAITGILLNHSRMLGLDQNQAWQPQNNAKFYGYKWDDFYVTLLEGDILLADNAGNIIEKIDLSQLIPDSEGDITHIVMLAEYGANIYFCAGESSYKTDINLTEGISLFPEKIACVDSPELPSEISAKIYTNYYGTGVSWERVILDLHTGNSLGLTGKLMSDFAALAMIFLVSSGLYNWFQRVRRK